MTATGWSPGAVIEIDTSVNSLSFLRKSLAARVLRGNARVAVWPGAIFVAELP